MRETERYGGFPMQGYWKSTHALRKVNLCQSAHQKGVRFPGGPVTTVASQTGLAGMPPNNNNHHHHHQQHHRCRCHRHHHRRRHRRYNHRHCHHCHRHHHHHHHPCITEEGAKHLVPFSCSEPHEVLFTDMAQSSLISKIFGQLIWDENHKA